jgi:MFS family permease
VKAQEFPLQPQITGVNMNDRASPPSSSRPAAVLVAVCLAALTLPLSFTGGAIATSAIAMELGGSPLALAWITNAFMLTFGSLLMVAGSIADNVGRKRVFLTGVALFVMASLPLSFASSVWGIDLLRALQGVGAAGALSGGSAALAQEFEGRARLQAFSMIGTTFGVGLAIGPIVAGWLIDSLGWRSIFVTSTAIGFLALLFGALRMRETRDPAASGIDWGGAVSFTGALSSFTFAVLAAPTSGWTSPGVTAPLFCAAGFLGAFVWIETRSRQPMLDLKLFQHFRFVGVQVLPIATCYSYVVLLILLPWRFVGIDGYSEIKAGILMLALSAPMLVVPALAATLTRWFTPGAIAGFGLLLAASGLLWLGRIESDSGSELILAMTLIGFGASLPWGLMDGLSVSVVPTNQAGMATGIFNTTKVAGEGVALAIVTALLASFIAIRLEHLPALTKALPSAYYREVANRLAIGDLRQAGSLLPVGMRAILVQSYMKSFAQLTKVLAVVTVASAIVVLVLLGRQKNLPNAHAKANCTAAPSSD